MSCLAAHGLTSFPHQTQCTGEWCNGSPPPFGGVRSRFESWLPSCYKVAANIGLFCPRHELTFVPVPAESPFSENDLRAAIEQTNCWADALRFLGYESKGDNYRTLQRYARRWNIPTAHCAQSGFAGMSTRVSSRSRETKPPERMTRGEPWEPS